MLLHYAHKSEDGRYQTILEHLTGVSFLSASFSVPCMCSLVQAAALAHDIGKYAPDFQARLEGSRKSFSHAICGALEYAKLLEKQMLEKRMFAPMLESCIAGHHVGLPDGGTSCNNSEDATLSGYLQRGGDYQGSGDYLSYRTELTLPVPETDDLFAILSEYSKKRDFRGAIEAYAFFTRYLFSCLTDADYLDTERFCHPEIQRELFADFSQMRDILNEKLAGFRHESSLQQARGRLQAQAYENGALPAQISILDMPTGSGKTLCSMKLALDKIAASNGAKKRIIYIIPYTSIIEQTADTFENLFGTSADILQHHTDYCFDDAAKEPSTIEKLKMATENWDAPVIITTTVRFFESIYHYRGSALRKLHNLANSVLIFDEVHMLPTEYLQPCLRAVGYVTRYLNSEAIFLTATMPDYRDLFAAYLPWCNPQVLIPDKRDFTCFEKCSYVNLGQTDYESITQKAMNCENALIIVNTRKTARQVYENLSGRKYHLSTYMTPHDRSAVISQIRENLANGERIFVVSTSLIEAGVDLDFHTVFRELAGLDSILQSGGRCNREGRRTMGTVYIFETDSSLHADMQLRQIAAKKILRDYKNIQSVDAVSAYYREIFSFRQEDIDANTIYEKDMKPAQIPFRSYAEHFKLISEQSIGVVIPNCEECRVLLEKLAAGDFSVRRKLQRFTVSLKVHPEFDEALRRGILSQQSGVYILENQALYHKDTGLNIDKATDFII